MSGSERQPSPGAAAPAEPERLASGPSGDPALDELGRWFQAVPPPAGLGSRALARVAERLDSASSPRPRRFSGAVVALGIVVLASASTAMWAAVRHPAQSGTMPGEPSAAVRASRPAPEARAPSPTRVAPPVPPSATPASDAAPESPPSARAILRASPSNDAAASSASTMARESAALERALTALRREHDAERALGLLDRYAGEFPAGVLRLEADVARVDANLALGRQSAALALLERMPLERVGRGIELGLVRGELLAQRDCSRAVRDFDRVIAAHAPPGLDERAVYGRAGCRATLGDVAGSQADLRLYLARYPSGRFAGAAHERLGGE